MKEFRIWNILMPNRILIRLYVYALPDSALKLGQFNTAVDKFYVYILGHGFWFLHLTYLKNKTFHLQEETMNTIINILWQISVSGCQVSNSVFLCF